MSNYVYIIKYITIVRKFKIQILLMGKIILRIAIENLFYLILYCVLCCTLTKKRAQSGKRKIFFQTRVENAPGRVIVYRSIVVATFGDGVRKMAVRNRRARARDRRLEPRTFRNGSERARFISVNLVLDLAPPRDNSSPSDFENVRLPPSVDEARMIPLPF